MKPAELAALVSEGARLDKQLSGLKAKAERLDEIKTLLRAEAGQEDATFTGSDGETAIVKQVKAGMVRKVPDDLLAQARRLAGKAIADLFSLSPVKDFELNALKLLPSKSATKLVALLRVPSTPRVSFE